MKKRQFPFKKRTVLMDILPAVVFMCAIITLGVFTGQMAIKIIPCVITLVVMLLSTRGNRYTFLLGGANSVIYAVGFVFEGLYSSVISCLLVSLPIQIVSFILWTRKKDGFTTVLKRMRLRLWLIAVGSTLALWVAAYFITVNISNASDLILLDSLLLSLGIVVSLALMLAYVDGMTLNILLCTLSLIMWAVLMSRDIKGITYFLIFVYNLYRVILGLINYVKIYKKQQAERLAEPLPEEIIP